MTGAILAGADERDIKKLSRLGILIGQAFQIQDDIIGIFDSQKNIGKPILSDLVESKKTLLVCHAFEKLRSSKRRTFTRYFNKSGKTYRDLVAIRRIFIQTGSLDYSLGELKTRVDSALKTLRSLKMRTAYKNMIEHVVHVLFKQSYRIAEQYKISPSSNGKLSHVFHLK